MQAESIPSAKREAAAAAAAAAADTSKTDAVNSNSTASKVRPA